MQVSWEAAIFTIVHPPGSKRTAALPFRPLPGLRILLCGLLLAAGPAAAETGAADLPEIKIFSPNRDTVFNQFAQELRHYHRRKAAGKPLPSPLFFCYQTQEGDSLFSVAAALNLPYETLATVNRIPAPGPLKAGRTLIFPSQPGLAVFPEPGSDFEALLAATFQPRETPLTLTPLPDKTFSFYPGRRLQPTARAFFLEVFFRFPLETGYLTSGFGNRPDPFTGEPQFHRGIDLAAPRGTPVLAAQSGKIVKICRESCNSVLGNYIIIEHPGNFRTLYGHLDTVEVGLEDEYLRGSRIGTVGITGRTTGPHLHFEIIRGEQSRNPEDYLRQ